MSSYSTAQRDAYAAYVALITQLVAVMNATPTPGPATYATVEARANEVVALVAAS